MGMFRRMGFIEWAICPRESYLAMALMMDYLVVNARRGNGTEVGAGGG
jgi:hypothetical protein